MFFEIKRLKAAVVKGLNTAEDPKRATKGEPAILISVLRYKSRWFESNQ